MLPGDSADLRKARGAFFTPAPVARFLAGWAVRSTMDDVLEPSCGEAVFLREVGRHGAHRGRVVGVELHGPSAREAERSLKADRIPADIHVGDFFVHDEFGAYDAVIGNPPYVRYQGWTGEARTTSRAAALRAGVKISNLASSWAAFTVHSALHLRPGGRLGLVLPAELLTVNYAASIRQFLLDRFSRVSLVLFDERVFPGVEVEAVLLLAEGYTPGTGRGTDHMELYHVKDGEGLTDLSMPRRWVPTSRSGKWSAGMLSTDGLAAYSAATSHEGFDVLESWGNTTLGMVTGNNKFFALTPQKVGDLGLTNGDLLRLSPPGSKHLRALTLTGSALARLGGEGEATWLFRPSGDPSPAGRRYIKSGEALDVDAAYKCRVRTPWWRVPFVKPADLLLTYMNADTPRLCANRAGVHHLNSVHGVYLKGPSKQLGISLLPIASLNSVTLLGAETVGRAYGGGMLKLEPREADQLPVPGAAVLNSARTTLESLRRPVTQALRAGRLNEAVQLVDEVLLVEALGIDRISLAAIRRDHAELTARRVTRGKETARG